MFSIRHLLVVLALVGVVKADDQVSEPMTAMAPQEVISSRLSWVLPTDTMDTMTNGAIEMPGAMVAESDDLVMTVHNVTVFKFNVSMYIESLENQFVSGILWNVENMYAEEDMSFNVYMYDAQLDELMLAGQFNGEEVAQGGIMTGVAFPVVGLGLGEAFASDSEGNYYTYLVIEPTGDFCSAIPVNKVEMSIETIAQTTGESREDNNGSRTKKITIVQGPKATQAIKLNK